MNTEEIKIDDIYSPGEQRRKEEFCRDTDTTSYLLSRLIDVVLGEITAFCRAFLDVLNGLYGGAGPTIKTASSGGASPQKTTLNDTQTQSASPGNDIITDMIFILSIAFFCVLAYVVISNLFGALFFSGLRRSVRRNTMYFLSFLSHILGNETGGGRRRRKRMGKETKNETGHYRRRRRDARRDDVYDDDDDNNYGDERGTNGDSDDEDSANENSSHTSGVYDESSGHEDSDGDDDENSDGGGMSFYRKQFGRKGNHASEEHGGTEDDTDNDDERSGDFAYVNDESDSESDDDDDY